MASAPRDGTRVLLRFRDHHNALTVTAGEWNDWLYDATVWELDGGESCDPLGWMLMPNAEVPSDAA